MATSSKCPDPTRWGDLLDCRLAEPAASALTTHLEGCAGCQSTLDRLTAGEPTWIEAASVLEERPRPALRQAMQQLKADGEAGLDTAGPTTIATLPFLRPSALRGHLGRLGSHEVLSVIGRGGMGVVLKAFDPALQRTTAIKVLAPQWATHKEARIRFEREAQAAARLRHDNVVAIHAVEEAEGLPYLVMEYVPGLSLQQRLDRDGPLAVEEILRIGALAAAGLAAAHEKDLIHRDVKPANILLDKDGNVRLTDFGLARAVDDSSLTQSGVIAGTPQYMAPEQARGEPLDHRCDLFSLGSVLYAMCTGRAPFRAQTTVAVLKRVCDDTPRDVRDYNPDIPDWLAEIIDKLHAKKPRDRFGSADEVARLLTRHLAQLRSPDTVEKPESVIRPRSSATPVWLPFALLVPGAAIGALVIWGAVSLLTPKRDASLPSEPTGEAAQAHVPPGPDPRVPAEPDNDWPEKAEPDVPRPDPPAPGNPRPDPAEPGQARPGPVGPAPAAPAPAPRVEEDPLQKTLAELDDSSIVTRRAALERLARMMPNDQRGKVARRLIDFVMKVEQRFRSLRPLAVAALGVWASENELPDLLKLVEFPDDVRTRKEALKVVSRFKNARVLATVIRAFREGSTRNEAGQALREMGTMAEKDVLAIVNEPFDVGLVFLKKDAIEVLVDIGTDKSVPTLKNALASRNVHDNHLKEPAQKALTAIAARKKK